MKQLSDLSLFDRVQQLEERVALLEHSRTLIDNIGRRPVKDLVFQYLDSHQTISATYLYRALDEKIAYHAINLAIYRLHKTGQLCRVSHGVYKRVSKESIK